MGLCCFGQWKPASNRHGQFPFALESKHLVEGASVMVGERIHHRHRESADLHRLAEQFKRINRTGSPAGTALKNQVSQRG